MATMKYNQIDATYPKAGENNSSQGFRDNFNYIKESLEYTDDSINDINLAAVKLNTVNSFTSEGVLDSVKLQNISETVIVGESTITTNITIDYSDGSYQSLILGGDVQINLTGFPEVDGITEKGRFAKLRLEIRSDSAQTRTLYFNPPGSGQIFYQEGWPDALSTAGATNIVLIEFSTRNGGQQIFAQYLGTYAQITPIAKKNKLFVQGNVTLGDSYLNDITDINSVPRMPRIPTVNIADITPQTGMVVYDSTSNQFKGYNGTSWVVLG